MKRLWNFLLLWSIFLLHCLNLVQPKNIKHLKIYLVSTMSLSSQTHLFTSVSVRSLTPCFPLNWSAHKGKFHWYTSSCFPCWKMVCVSFCKKLRSGYCWCYDSNVCLQTARRKLRVDGITVGIWDLLNRV